MRLWSLHPHWLDRQGLVACWREGLLAQKVLRGETLGYQQHPQLDRFRAHRDPVGMIGLYLWGLCLEAQGRGYSFDANRIVCPHGELSDLQAVIRELGGPIPVTEQQLAYEWRHLQDKLALRDPERLAAYLLAGAIPTPHPLFRMIPGEIAAWEKTG
jgi:hypothetical protein